VADVLVVPPPLCADATGRVFGVDEQATSVIAAKPVATTTRT
jgi:hypothetical protein